MSRKIHHLKTWNQFFDDVLNGLKPFELRRNDRDFQEGDILHLLEVIPFDESDPVDMEFTGRTVCKVVNYMLKDAVRFGLQNGFCIMAVDNVVLDTVELDCCDLAYYTLFPDEAPARVVQEGKECMVCGEEHFHYRKD